MADNHNDQNSALHAKFKDINVNKLAKELRALSEGSREFDSHRNKRLSTIAEQVSTLLLGRVSWENLEFPDGVNYSLQVLKDTNGTEISIIDTNQKHDEPVQIVQKRRETFKEALVEAIFEWRVNKVEKDGIIEPNQRQMLRTYLTNFLNGKETENEQAHLLLEALDSYCQETERGALSLDIEVEEDENDQTTLYELYSEKLKEGDNEKILVHIARDSATEKLVPVLTGRGANFRDAMCTLSFKAGSSPVAPHTHVREFTHKGLPEE